MMANPIPSTEARVIALETRQEEQMRRAKDYDFRLRALEAERATNERLDKLESRVAALEITAAKAVVVVGAVSFVASAAASAIVIALMQSVVG